MKIKSFRAWENPCYPATSCCGKLEVSPPESLETEKIKDNSVGGQDVQVVHRIVPGETQDGTAEAKTMLSQYPATTTQFLDDPGLLDVIQTYIAPEVHTSDDGASQSTSAEGLESSHAGSEETVSVAEGNAAVNGSLCDGMNKPGGRLMLSIKKRNQQRVKKENTERRKAAKKRGLKAETNLE